MTSVCMTRNSLFSPPSQQENTSYIYFLITAILSYILYTKILHLQKGEHKETVQDDGYVYYLDCGDITSVSLCPDSSNCT